MPAKPRSSRGIVLPRRPKVRPSRDRELSLGAKTLSTRPYGETSRAVVARCGAVAPIVATLPPILAILIAALHPLTPIIASLISILARPLSIRCDPFLDTRNAIRRGRGVNPKRPGLGYQQQPAASRTHGWCLRRPSPLRFTEFRETSYGRAKLQPGGCGQ